MNLSALVRKLLEEQDGDVLREGIRVLSQALMETEVAGLIGAERHERSGDRTASQWESDADLGHAHGDDRTGAPEGQAQNVFPIIAAARRRAEHALFTVVQEAYVHGVSTRKVDDLVRALGINDLEIEVSRTGGELDTVVEAFRTRPLISEHRYLWVDATYHKVRVDGRVLSPGHRGRRRVTSEVDRQVLGIHVGPRRTARSGRHFCGAWSTAGSRACGW